MEKAGQKNKKVLVSILALLLTMGLVACGDSDDSDDEPSDEPEDQVEEEAEETGGDEEADASDGEYPIEVENDAGVAVIESEVKAVAAFDLGILDIMDTLGHGDMS